MTVTIYRPDGDTDADAVTLAALPGSLSGARIAVLDNGKPNAALVMDRLAHALASATDATVSLITKKGPDGRSANAAIPCAPDVFERVVSNADIVITGAADCGSCTAYSVHDTVALERAGRPTILVTTTRFEPIARTLAANHGLPDIRLLVLDHPIGGTDAPTLHARADAATDPLLTLLTDERPWARKGTSQVALRAQGVDGVVAELRELVGSDGAALETIVHDDDAGSIRLRLIVPDEHCAECVMPREVLEKIALDRFADHGIRHVSIDDPREDVRSPMPFEHLDEIDHLLTTTKAVRKRLDMSRPVPRDVITTCIELACFAPNASNAQEWHWVVVDDPDLRARAAEQYHATLAPPVRLMLETKLAKGDEDGARITRSILWLAEHLHEVPAIVIPCYDVAAAEARYRELIPDPALRDRGGVETHQMTSGMYASILPAVWNFQLALRSRGLGSVLTTAHQADQPAMARILGIPDTWDQTCLLPVAYTTGGDFTRSPRRPVDDVVVWNGRTSDRG